MKPSKRFLLVALSFFMFSSRVALSASSAQKGAAPGPHTHFQDLDMETEPRGDFTLSRIALPQCASPNENGRWRNLDAKGDPAFIDIKMVDCGDQQVKWTTDKHALHVAGLGQTIHWKVLRKTE